MISIKGSDQDQMDQWRRQISGALAGADQSFADTGDVMEALGWVAFAAKAGLPLPKRIGVWLHAAIHVYRSDKNKTLDAALGLDAVGPKNPRLRMRNRSRMDGALAQMYVLWLENQAPHSRWTQRQSDQWLDRATAIVATSTKLAKKTLRSHFRKSRLGAEVRRAKDQQRSAAAPALWNVWPSTGTPADTDEPDAQ